MTSLMAVFRRPQHSQLTTSLLSGKGTLPFST
jgi:hypothetical protein